MKQFEKISVSKILLWKIVAPTVSISFKCTKSDRHVYSLFKKIPPNDFILIQFNRQFASIFGPTLTNFYDVWQLSFFSAYDCCSCVSEKKREKNINLIGFIKKSFGFIFSARQKASIEFPVCHLFFRHLKQIKLLVIIWHSPLHYLFSVQLQVDNWSTYSC